MDIKIDSIEVTVTGEDWDEAEITKEVERHLLGALEIISKEDLVTGVEMNDIETLDLPVIDWDAEFDKTGKLVQLIRMALES